MCSSREATKAPFVVFGKLKYAAAEWHGQEMVVAVDQEGAGQKKGGKITENLGEDGNQRGCEKGDL